MNNPSLRQEVRYEPATVIPLKQDTSLIDWLKANNRIMEENVESENEKYLEEDEDIDQLMGEDYRGSNDLIDDSDVG